MNVLSPLQVGVVVLLYLLIDNMFSKSRLTPRRIKVWMSLLCVVMTWTLLSFHLLICAQALETAAQRATHSLSNELVHMPSVISLGVLHAASQRV